MKSRKEKTHCGICNQMVEVVNLISHEEYYDQIFSCGHGVELKKEN
jgi:hypothetical protein